MELKLPFEATTIPVLRGAVDKMLIKVWWKGEKARDSREGEDGRGRKKGKD
jgi:hypothetical protein